MTLLSVHKAWKAYHEGKLKDALKFFNIASKYLGLNNFKANMTIIENKLNLNNENNFEDNEIQKSKTEINKDNSEANIPKIIEQCQKIIKYKPEIFSLWMKNIRIAAILDEFTWQSYSPEANILQLTPDRWHDELELFNPELLFVESAWRGKDKLWKNIIHKKPLELMGILKWCKENNIHFCFL